ncbi:ABC transporter substrate-binding protein [Streptosporangium carneum]|uniref:Amino acid ABC transporter, substrate-binding protein n=1 Tax=Streptosporangium carneum TaxID=47481 RepID=A0A9W6MEJ4_9ACTN|nr:ABC transporter substrate-binding protein [Streptosporangium carneum]GLK10903.1 putative amino acid ABC transporter, substrate-binding protein [Streptosporangium carneum]
MSLLSRLTPALVAAPLLLAAACGSTGTSSTTSEASTKPAEKTAAPAGNAESGAAKINTSPEQNRIKADKVDAIAAQVPEAIRTKGELVVAFSGEGAPPLAFLADDDSTVIGVETDLAHIVADTLGLKVKEEITSWENLFLGVKSGKYDVAFNNVTVTEERKDIYDFATYRVDQLAWQTAKNSPITEIKQPSDIAGRRVAVGSGTNQEKILLDWDAQNQKAGLKPAQIQNYQKYVDALLSLKSGRIEAYIGPNPSLAYQNAVGGDTKIVGTVSGAGPDLQGLIAAMTKKDSGLVKPLNAAFNELIKNGKYGEVLERWNLSNEALTESQINPPGLPRQPAK